MAKLDGKVAIITGGAGGIGSEAVRRFVAEGAKVVFADLDEEKGAGIAKEVGASAIFQRADVTSEADIQGLVDRARSDFGGLDIMFSNAGGFGARGSILDISVDDFDFTLSLLLRSVFLGIKCAGSVMAEQGHGAIVNTASISATTPGYGPHIYQAAKAAVVQLTRSVALELGEKGIRINCVSPGGVPTPLISSALGLGEDAMEGIAKGMSINLPMGRTATPGDIAGAAVFLCSDDASYITAQNLIVDGAESTGQKFSKQALN
jgi:NAD(P)-dependent dehydrogenase (short-subunit alcohol dehydrogenase family)